jgi:cytidine deaminase
MAVPNGYPKRLSMSIQKQSEELNAEERERLRELARVVAAHAYAPYSGFRVGAALLLDDGTVVVGCNVENCSYRLTSCAEQGAIARAVAEFGPGIRVRAVAVANLNAAASMPCGACRQTLSEFGEDAMVVLYPGEGGAMEETTLGELLPHAFRGEFLEPKA